VSERRKSSGLSTGLSRRDALKLLGLGAGAVLLEACKRKPIVKTLIPPTERPTQKPTKEPTPEPTPTIPPIPDNGVGGAPYPTSAEGFGEVGGNPEELRSGIMELSGGDLANVEFLLKWRLWKEYNEANPDKIQ
jgi:hypothetical protein